jgi:hypothetical protein
MRGGSAVVSFQARERRRQTDYFVAEFSDKSGYRGMPFRLQPLHRKMNLSPAIRDIATRYFANRIAWHTHANHALSSQICCLNFLMPLAERPALLARLVARALAIPEPEMLCVEEGPDGRPWFVGFEWNGQDYLGESRNGVRMRGANCTSADAVVRFRNGARIEMLLIEWKYTERYGARIPPKGNQTRSDRYRELAFHPNGPIQDNFSLTLENFFYEPFYQLLRQQMLAFQMQEARERAADRVRVLHISPAANLALKKVTSPAFRGWGEGDAFALFKSVLTEPENFIFRSTEELFAPLITELGSKDEWSDYLFRRYKFLMDGP